MKQLVPLLLLMASLTACAGGDEAQLSPTGTTTTSPTAQATAEPEPSPTGVPASPTAATSMTAEERTETEALLKTAALRLEDLPSGFTLDEERFSTNEEDAEESTPGDPTLEDLNRWGRILGYEADYSREVSLGSLLGGTAFLQTTATVYRDSTGADEAFEFVRERTSDPESAKAFEASVEPAEEVRDVSISPMSFARVGEDRIAFEIKFTMHNPYLDTDFDYVAQVVGVRRDRGIGTIMVLAVTSPSPVDELEALARTLDERMKDALD